jgi:drug/metabolite transporter (DMT)-like permease
MFLSYEFTSYAKGFCLFATNTFFAPFLAFWMLNERVRKWDIIGIVLGFIGLLCLLKPWIVPEGEGNLVKDLIGCMIGIFAAFSQTFAVIYTRKLSKSPLHFSIQPFYFICACNIMNSTWGFVLPSNKSTVYSLEFYLYTLGLSVMLLFQ